jgi:hypothetical protein
LLHNHALLLRLLLHPLLVPLPMPLLHLLVEQRFDTYPARF